MASLLSSAITGDIAEQGPTHVLQEAISWQTTQETVPMQRCH